MFFLGSLNFLKWQWQPQRLDVCRAGMFFIYIFIVH
jgi:hypothetical protein